MNYTFIYLILGLLLAGGIVWVLILLFSDKEQPKDDVIINTSYCPNITRGHTKLAQLDSKIGKSGRVLITARALDVDYDKCEKEHIKLPIIVKFAIPSELVETFSKGDASSYRHEKIAYPRNAKDLPVKIRNTRFGLALAEHIENKARVRAIEEIMTKDNQAQTKIAQMLSHDHLLMEVERVHEDIHKMQSDAIKDIKKSPSSSFEHVPHREGSI